MRLKVAVLAGCACALGFAPAARAQDPPLSQYQAKVLIRNLSNPTSFAFRPDGRIYITLKNGIVRLLNPATGDTSTAAMLPAASLREDGLHSLVLDPDFATTLYVYALFSERTATDTGYVVARYLTDGTTGALLAGSRVNLLRIPYTLNNSTAEHNTGSLAFGPDGNLFVSLADNTQNIFNGTGAGYAPRDTTRPLYDAQRSASNTNDLRGKILRIRPEANGTYSIPAGNLRDSINNSAFNPNWNGSEDTLSKVRPEIFTMGLRHPFRISLDAQTGWLFWAEPGPNATSDNASQGPRGYEVVSLAKGPGNYGWPYCRANPNAIPKPGSVGGAFCYTQYNYGTATGGPMYNPAALRNTSRNNTGIVNLPPMKPASFWYAYDTAGAAFPVFGYCAGNCNTAMIGPVYNHNPAQGSARLPAVFDRHVFVIEWVRNRILVAPVLSGGTLGALRLFRSGRDSVTNGPIDVKIGPDGALYFLNWVNSTGSTTAYSYPTNGGAGTLVRFAYTGTHTGIAHPYGVKGIGNAAGQLHVAGTGGVLAWPEGALRADFYALTGEYLGGVRRAEASGGPVLRYPESVRGVVRVRFQGR